MTRARATAGCSSFGRTARISAWGAMSRSGQERAPTGSARSSPSATVRSMPLRHYAFPPWRWFGAEQSAAGSSLLLLATFWSRRRMRHFSPSRFVRATFRWRAGYSGSQNGVVAPPRPLNRALLGGRFSGIIAGVLGFAALVVPEADLDETSRNLVDKLANGPTKAYAAARTLLKAWSAGGIAAADVMMLDVAIDLFGTEDTTKGILNSAKAIQAGVQPSPLTFLGR